MMVRVLHNTIRENIPETIVDRDSMAGQDAAAVALRVKLRDRDVVVAAVDQPDRPQRGGLESLIVGMDNERGMSRANMARSKEHKPSFGSHY